MNKNALKKRWIPALAAAVVLAAAVLFLLKPWQKKATPAGVNLIAETDFSRLQNGDSAWYEDAYVHSEAYTVFSFDEGREGGVSGHIENRIANDARFATDVAVEPDSLYCLSGWIKASCRTGMGANLSVAGVYAFSEPLYDTEGEWRQVSFYGRTGADQHFVTVFARLGGYSGEAEGEAWFDGISLTRVDALPDGVRAAAWYAEDSRNEESAQASGGRSRGPLLPSALLVFFAGLYLVLLVRGAFVARSGRTVPAAKGLLILFLIALFLRLILMSFVHGYNVDVSDFIAWGQSMAEDGPGVFYNPNSFCDYPPGYIWILGLFVTLGQWFGASASEWLIKLPPVLADLLGAGLLTAYILKKEKLSLRDGRLPLSALMPGFFYLLNPTILLTGAGWGQSDGVMMLFLLVTVLAAIEGRWEFALPAYVTAVLIKPQALMFGPMGLAALGLDLFSKRKDGASLRKALIRFGIGAGGSLLLAAALILPFKGDQPFGWLIALYGRTMSYYAHATVNACNLYFLIGANWVGIESTAAPLFPLLAGLLLALSALAAFFLRDRENGKEKLLCLGAAAAGALVSLTALFPFSYQAYSTLLIVLALGLALAAFILAGQLRHLPLYGAILLALLFNLGGMMHERYLFAALPLLVLAWYLEKDHRVLVLLGLITAASLLNVGCVLSRNVRIGGAEGHLTSPMMGIQSDMIALEYASACLSVLSAAFSVYIALRRTEPNLRPLALGNRSLQNDEQKEGAGPALPPVLEEKDWLSRHRMDKKDWLIMAAITVCYALLAFWHLGSFTSPQTGYMFSETEQTVTFDLGEKRSDFRMLYIGGVHQYDREFSVAVSDDGERFGEDYLCNMDIGNLFQWYYVRSWKGPDNLSLSGRYVRITGRPGLNLYEVIFRDPEGNVLPIAGALSSAGDSPAALYDEQNTLSGEPGWYNSMYFDEIYHARTAYEHLTGMYPYETTHPPLGKVLMSWAIAVFGMTPFGWRFAGTLCGVLMLPAMYLLGRLLFKKRRFAILPALMMALDTLHYTQTRLATIDSFVVLFILWSVYFMLRWFFTDFFGASLKQNLVPLGLSGLFMGLAVASKWTGCYAGVGLAALFFIGLWRKGRLIFAAKQLLREKKAEEEERKKTAPARKGEQTPPTPPPFEETEEGKETVRTAQSGGRVLLTLASCLIFFIAVPLGIYYLSYIPYFAPSGGVSAQKIIQAAEGMLSYHSQPGLGMDHPFYSPWYEWPLSMKPMYYAADAYEPAGTACTILAFGNPAVWWVGIAAMLMVFYALIRHQIDPILFGGKRKLEAGWFCPENGRDIRPLLLTICFAAQYLPWMLVPRGTYIYHYFPSVPFVILAVSLIGEYWTDRRAAAALKKGGEAAVQRAERISLMLVALYILICAAFFIAFFPYASGIQTSTKWLDAMNWFGNLYY